MDKYEYKLRSEEIKDLIAKKEYAEAVAIADTVDWRRVKNIMMLTMVSDLYKINRRYDVSRDILLLAYDRHPGGRTIVYSLCELSVKLREFVQAIEYYKEFVRVAPNDTGRYILKYKIYDAQEVSLEERIEVLEEFKSVDYREKWGYELAFLYHRAGMEQQCVAECDELILTFGEGKYVVKAMELKMLHQPLTSVQQERYDGRNQKKMTQMSQAGQAAGNVINRAATVAEASAGQGEALVSHETLVPEQPLAGGILNADTRVLPGKDLDIQVKTFDANNKYNTMNIQAALADSMKEIMADETAEQGAQRKAAEQELARRKEAQRQAQLKQLAEQETRRKALQEKQAEAKRQAELQHQAELEARRQAELEAQKQTASEVQKQSEAQKENITQSVVAPLLQNTGEIKEIKFADLDAQSLINDMAAQAAQTAADTDFDNLLAMENDGQISLVVPEEEKVEKQITGQLSIEDILLEWEKMKQDSEQRSMDDIKQRVLQQTGEMFTVFDRNTKSGILAGLEDEKNSLTNLPVTPEEPLPEMKSEVELLTEAVSLDQGLEGEDLPEVEELTEIENDALPEAAEDLDVSVKNDIYSALNDELEDKDEQLESEVAEEAFDTGDLVSVADKLVETAEKEVTGQEPVPAVSRALTEDEKELFGALIQTDQMKSQIAEAIDTVSLASYTGNVIITGEAGSGTLTLAKNLIKSVQMSDNNFSGKVAKISGAALDKKDIPATISKLRNGALIVEKANGMSADSLKKLMAYLDQEKSDGIIVILEDTKLEMRKCLNKNQALADNFNARIDINAMDNDALVAFARDYAYEQEFSIDNLGILALYTRIADLQSGEHSVNLAEVRDIVDEAIWSASRKNPKHFFAVLSGKRYDDEDMIVLREKDFIC